MKNNVKIISNFFFYLVLIFSIFMLITFLTAYFLYKEYNLLFLIVSTFFFGSFILIANLFIKGKMTFTISSFLNMDRVTKITFGICSLAFSLNGFYSAFATPKDKLIDLFGAFLFGLGGIALLLPDSKKK